MATRIDPIRYAIAIGGDTDTIASMAAAITGAHLGAEAIPDAWLARLEGRERLIALADGLVRVSAGGGSDTQGGGQEPDATD